MAGGASKQRFGALGHVVGCEGGCAAPATQVTPRVVRRLQKHPMIQFLSVQSMQRYIIWAAIGSVLIMAVMSGCFAPSSTPIATMTLAPTLTLTVTLSPTPAQTPSAPPEDAVMVEIVDLSQVSLALPVRGQLLVRACETSSFDDDDESIICDFGLLDLHIAQFVRLKRLVEQVRCTKFREYPPSGRPESCPHFRWSPDGTQFVYYQTGWVYGTLYDSIVFRADGSTEHNLGLLSRPIWSPDGHYLVGRSCQQGRGVNGIVYTVYDAHSWEDVCRVGWSNPMGICGDKGVGSSPNQCILPLADGRIWLLTVPEQTAPSSYDLISLACNSQEDCPSSVNEVDSVAQEYSQDQRTSSHYQTSIENYWLRVVDIDTGNERAYVIPGYNITVIEWSPD